jgi:hypothetical protein
MPQHLEFDSADLRGASADVTHPGELIRKVLSTFRASVDPLPPEPWGDDELGKKFADAYLGITDPSPDSKGRSGHYKLLGALEDLITGLENLGGKVGKMADAYEAAEDGNRH